MQDICREILFSALDREEFKEPIRLQLVAHI